MTGILRHGLRFLRRESLQAEMRLVFLALALTIAAMATVGLLTNRIAKTLVQQSNELLGADLVIASSRPIPQSWLKEAGDRAIRTSLFQEFPSVLISTDDTALVEVKAVTEGYPLRGRLRLNKGQGTYTSQQNPPASGTIWAEKGLLRKLALQPGDTITLGKATFTIDAVIEQEPDRGGSLFSLAPRVMLNLADMAATGLIGEGSRVRHQLLLAGTEQTMQAYRAWLQPRLGSHYQIQSVRDSRPEVRASLERAERFLALSLIVTIMLACLAIWVAMQNWVQKRLIHTAVLRTIGLTRLQITALYLSQLSILSILASALALLAAYGLQSLLASLLQQYMSSTLPPAEHSPALWSSLLGFLLVLAFSLPAYWRLVSVSPMRVLRSVPDELQPVVWPLIFGLVALCLILYGITRDLQLMAIILAALAAALLLLLLLAAGLLLILHHLSRRLSETMKFGIQALIRHRRETLMAISVFGLSFIFITLLTLIRTDLLDQWRNRLPADTPNIFLINIQPPEIQQVQRWLSDNGLKNIQFFPMIRGRLIKINNRTVTGNDYNTARAKRMLRREFNLSWDDTLPAHNNLSAGQWWQAGDPQPQWSVESGIAEVLGIQTGDTITYDVAGRQVTGRITSLREVSWDSFKVNFFVIGTRRMLADMPTQYISSFYLPVANNHLMDRLVQQYPSVTILDVEALMSRVRTVINRVSYAAEAAFLFTLAAAVLLVTAMVMSTRRLRQHENALMRAMGATRHLISRAQTIEFLLIGACSGLTAVILANIIAWWVSVELLDIGFRLNIPLALIVIMAGMLLVMLTGWAILRQQHHQTPATLLRTSE